MILKQFYLGCLAHASYLVADENAPEQLRLSWPGGTTTIRDGNRIVLGRPHPALIGPMSR